MGLYTTTGVLNIMCKPLRLDGWGGGRGKMNQIEPGLYTTPTSGLQCNVDKQFGSWLPNRGHSDYGRSEGGLGLGDPEGMHASTLQCHPHLPGTGARGNVSKTRAANDSVRLRRLQRG